jgi:uncharacterized membrane protein
MQLNKNQVNSLYLVSYFLLGVMIINSSYLAYKYLKFHYGAADLTSFDCSDGCDTVMMSNYSMIFGIPVPVYGLLFFILITVLFIILTKFNDPSASWLDQLSKLESKSSSYKVQKQLFELLLIVGCLAAVGFIYLLYFVIEAMCKFCLLSHICLFLFTIIYFVFLRRFKFRL